jgi:uncharacterized membrane protein (DUF485 family)
MAMTDKPDDDNSAKNRRLAIVLGLIAVVLYLGYILAYYFD